MGTGNAFEALSQCWLRGRKIHTAVFTRLLPAKFEKFCIVVWHFFPIQDFFFYITLHVLLHQYHLAGCWFHPILISQDYFYTTYINYFKMHSDLDLVN